MKSLGRFCISFVFWAFSLVVAGVPFFAEQFLLRKTTHGLAYPAVYVLIMGLFHLLAPDSMDALRNWRDRSGLLNGLVRRLMLAWGFYAVLATVIFLLFDNSLVAQIILATTVVLGTAWLLLTQRGRQALIVAGVGISSLPQRWGASSVIVIGIAGVVGVLVAMLAMGEGFQNTLKQTGSDDTAIVLRGGSQAETNSVITRDQVPLISALAGIAKDGNGRAQVSPELSQVINLPTVSDGNDANAQLRGVGSEAWSLRPNVKMVKGRKFGAGLRELIAGQGAAKQFRGLEVGKQIELANQNWTVVGIFAAGDSHDSELWADGEVLASTYQRTSFQSVTVKLAGKDGFKDLKKALAADPRLKLDVQTTHDYYAKQSEGLTKLITALGIVIGAIMAIGAVFGALNTMYAAVAGRAREIATLRALGFRSLPVVVAVMLETMLLALLGGLLGAVLAWLVFNGYQVSTLGSNFSQVVFQFKVSPELLWNGLKWALGIGLVGGLLPALRAARLPVTTALRAA